MLGQAVDVELSLGSSDWFGKGEGPSPFEWTKESGVFGEMGRVSLFPVCPINQKISPQ